MVRDRACCDCGYLNESRAALCGNCGGPLRPRRAGTPVLPTTLPEEIGLAALRGSDSEPTCGSGITDPPSPRQCPSCHYAARMEDQFCRRCGAMLETSPQFCKRCGDPVEADEKCCNRCGLPLR